MAFKIDEAAIRQLAKLLAETDLTEIHYEQDGHRIHVVKNPPATMMAPATGATPNTVEALPATKPVRNPDHLVKAPMVGTIYLAPQPGAAPFVRIGDQVQAGQTLMVIEAMKVMNPIKAQRSGTVTEILVQDAMGVEFDQALLVLE